MSDSVTTKPAIPLLSPEDRKVLTDIYVTDKSGKLTKAQFGLIVKDFNEGKITDDKALEILKRFDTDGNGTIDEIEGLEFDHQLDINETNVRYAGYTASFARYFRYLAFTSDFGEALRPVVSKHLVTGSYAVALGYCVSDVAWEGYKLKNRGYLSEKGEPMTMTQCLVERSAFQAVASMAVPTLLIHTAVDVTRKYTVKYGRFQKWGPSIVGLGMIPLLPLYLDAPVGKYIIINIVIQ